MSNARPSTLVTMRVIDRIVSACFVALCPTVVCAWQVAVKTDRKSKEPGIWIVRKEAATKLSVDDDTVPLSWSNDGRWLVLGNSQNDSNWRISLYDQTSAVSVPVPLSGLCSEPSWAPDGRKFVTSMAGKGIVSVDVAGSDPIVAPLTPSGLCPSWSPNGGRIAFAERKPNAGVWVMGSDGQHAHRIESKLDPVSLSWSPDGQNLLVIVPGKSPKQYVIHVLSATGKNDRTIGECDRPVASWAPNGSRILTSRGKVWGYYAVSGQWTAMGCDSPFRPTWEGSNTIVWCDSGKAVRKVLGQQTSSSYFPSLPLDLPEGHLASVVPCAGLVLEGASSNPFREVPLPKAGQVRITGTVEDIDLTNDTVTIAVNSVTSSDGMELNLAKPLHQTVLLTSLSHRMDGTGNKPLAVTDFVQEGEVALTIMGMKAGVPETVAVVNGLIPELLVDPSPVTIASSRPIRALDYDGVSMDVVTVPLLFPVAGKVQWSDTFLANRDGGERRHHGQDLMAPKMRPLLACFDGTVRFNTSKSGHNTISLRGDDGWTVVYMHVNNDTPGTDDGHGGPRFAFAPGLKSGDRVVRGQLVGFCGDSGNAESTASHCHFELHDDTGGGVLNACPSLQDAEHADAPITIDPTPTLTVPSGQSRWDIQIVQIDRERRVIVGEVISASRNGRLEPCLSPRRLYVKITDQTKFALRGDAKESRSLSDLKEGNFATIVGLIPSGEQAVTAVTFLIGLTLKD